VTDRHKINRVNAELVVEHVGPFGHVNGHPQDTWVVKTPQNGEIDLCFHAGEGVANGLTNEVLLAVVEERLVEWQKGEHACEENGWAIDYVRAALEALRMRAEKRGETP
jgi:hypothetical protein